MKFRIITLGLFVILLWGCGQSNQSRKTTEVAQIEKSDFNPVNPGTVVSQIKERVVEDKLNNRYFSVAVVTTDSSNVGLYRLKLAYGYFKRELPVAFPKWSDGVFPKPVLKKGNKPYQIVLGFRTANNIFHEYYLIKMVNGNLEVKQTHRYILQH